MPQLKEKPHMGVPSKNPALHQVHEVCNSTTALGFQAALHLERIRSRYTGKERDTESGNDYFDARYYASSMGRFMSPDWSAQVEPVPYAKLYDPQSLNLYVYGANNPLKFRDMDGHYHCDADTSAVKGDAVVVTAGACHSDWSDFATNFYHRATASAQKGWQNAARIAASPKGRMAAKSLKHGVYGGLKGLAAAGLLAAAPETFGLTAYAGGYLAVGAAGEFVAAATDAAGMLGSDASLSKTANAADAAAAASTITGATTLAVTGGNVSAASRAASVEDVFTTAGVSVGTGEAFAVTDLMSVAGDANDLASPDDQQ
jgi:RHS repeat-associated protein